MKSKRIRGILARCYDHVRATENVTKERMKIFGATFHTFNRSLKNLDPERNGHTTKRRKLNAIRIRVKHKR